MTTTKKVLKNSWSAIGNRAAMLLITFGKSRFQLIFVYRPDIISSSHFLTSFPIVDPPQPHTPQLISSSFYFGLFSQLILLIFLPIDKKRSAEEVGKEEDSLLSQKREEKDEIAKTVISRFHYPRTGSVK